LNRAILEKLIVTQLIQKFPAFMLAEGSIPCLQEPTTGPYPEPEAVADSRQGVVLQHGGWARG